MRSISAVLLLALLPTLTQAHGLDFTCKLRGKSIDVEVYYDNDERGKNAKVEVLDAQDKVIASGITDAKGNWSFAMPEPGRYEVRVDAGAGHRAEKPINVPGTRTYGASVTINEGATRAEFTSVPWLKIGIGLAVIGVCSGAFLVVSLLRATSKPAGDEGACEG